jgi:hypothetical protein
MAGTSVHSTQVRNRTLAAALEQLHHEDGTLAAALEQLHHGDLVCVLQTLEREQQTRLRDLAPENESSPNVSAWPH